jgi:hypothetical protein
VNSARLVCPQCASSTLVPQEQLPIACCGRIYRQFSEFPKGPGLLRKARNLGRDGLAHLLKPAKVDDATREWRREQCLTCVEYPGVPVIVVDQSGEQASGADYEFCRAFPGVTWIDLPYDSGISVCRNRAVAEVKTPLVLLLDDDHILSHETPLAALLDILNSDQLDLVCGVIRQASQPGHSANACHWHADFEQQADNLHAVAPKRPWMQSAGGYWYRRIDRYINCFLARKELLTRLPWNDVHKIAGEHLDHVLLLYHSGAKCAYTPNFVVGELKTESPDYNALRRRNSEHWARTRWNIDTTTGTWKTELEPGIVRRASAVPQALAPNIVLLTVGHTGSSLVAGLLSALGWTIPTCDPEYNEPRLIRDTNEALCGGIFEAESLPEILRSFPRPWLLKDPRFCETLEAWLPAFAETKPLLLWLERDRPAVEASWLRRPNEPLEVLDQRLAAAERHFAYWPWAKQRIGFEDIGAAIGGFDRARAMRA